MGVYVIRGVIIVIVNVSMALQATNVRDPQDLFTCENGGSCVNTNVYLSCGCVNGFYGDSCEFDPCTQDIVRMERVKMMEAPYRVTVFGTEYSGAYCRNCDDPCDGIDCNGHGSCLGGICMCDPNYSGDSCEIYTDPCLSITCSNHGTCLRSCSVTRGYLGVNCESPLHTASQR